MSRNLPSFTEDEVYAASTARLQNYLTDDDLDEFIARCEREPGRWHAVTAHASGSAASKRVHQFRTRPRTKDMPVKWRVYPSSKEEIAAGRAHTYVVGRWDPLADRPRTLVEPWMIVDGEPWFVYDVAGDSYARTIRMPEGGMSPRVEALPLSDLIARMETP